MRHRNDSERGQVIVIFAFSAVALLLIAGLVLDVARVYTVLRYQRSVADAAALAGAQDLQDVSTSGEPLVSVSPGDYSRAICDAYALLVSRLGGGSSAQPCPSTPPNPYSASIGSYAVTITSPYTGVANPAVKVSISQPFSLTFGNLVCLLPGSQCSAGAPVWHPAIASVAESIAAPQYALVTLQPPEPHCSHNTCTDENLTKDLVVSGSNTALNILKGDVGSNTSADTNQTSSSTGNPACIGVTAGYYVDHYDDLTVPGQTWTACSGTPSNGRQLGGLINDPAYMYPSFVMTGSPYEGAPQYTQATGATSCDQTLLGKLEALLPNVTTWTCYQPGVYTDNFQVTSNTAGAYLTPGPYYFPAGMQIGGTLAGGLVGGQQGVDLVFNESNSTSGGTFKGNNAVNVLLNTCQISCTADIAPAQDWVQESSGSSGSFSGAKLETPQGFLLTIEVLRDNSCFSGEVPQLCATSSDATVNLGGNGILNVGGVIYGPSDNMQINSANTVQNGTVGQVISYTVTYTGQATLNQQYPGSVGNRVLRLSTVCSPGASCP